MILSYILMQQYGIDAEARGYGGISIHIYVTVIAHAASIFNTGTVKRDRIIIPNVIVVGKYEKAISVQYSYIYILEYSL